MIKTVKKNVLLGLLTVTGALSRLDVPVPSKWYSLLESLAVSTGTVHSGLCTIDKDAMHEFQEIEETVERRLGLKSYYSPEDIREIKEMVEKEAEGL